MAGFLGRLLLGAYHLLIDFRAGYLLWRRFPHIQLWACYTCAKILRRFNARWQDRRATLAEIRAKGDYVIDMEAR